MRDERRKVSKVLLCFHRDKGGGVKEGSREGGVRDFCCDADLDWNSSLVLRYRSFEARSRYRRACRWGDEGPRGNEGAQCVSSRESAISLIFAKQARERPNSGLMYKLTLLLVVRGKKTDKDVRDPN